MSAIETIRIMVFHDRIGPGVGKFWEQSGGMGKGSAFLYYRAVELRAQKWRTTLPA